MIVTPEGYLAIKKVGLTHHKRATTRIGALRKKTWDQKGYRDWFLIIHHHIVGNGVVRIGRVEILFPTSEIGKRVRFKIEEKK